MSAPESAGLLGSLRRVLAGAVETAQVRLDLLAVELEQEKRRLLEALVLVAGALLLLGVGLVLAAHRDFKRSLEACGRPDWRMGGRKMPFWTAWNWHLHRCLVLIQLAHSVRWGLAESDHQG